MPHNGVTSSESRRIVVVDVYNEFNNSSETAATAAGVSSRKINDEQRQSRQKINGTASYNSMITSGNGVSRNNLGSAETVKVNGHHSEKSAPSQSDFVTVLRVDDNSEECAQKTRNERRHEELNSGEQNFVTILQVNEMMKANGSMVTSTMLSNASRSSHVIDTVTVYRLPGERLGMALKFEGGDANTTAPVSKVLIQSIQPESPAARAESNGSLLGCLQEGDTILDIDGREVTSLTRLDCVSLLREASVCIKLKVKREFIHEESVCSQNEETEDGRPKLPAKKKGAPPPIPPRKTACLSQSPTLGSFVKDFTSVEGVKEKIQRLECVQSTSTVISTEKVLKRPSHPPPLPPRRPRSGSESTSDTEEAEKTPTFPGGSLSMRLPGWEELMQRRADRFVENQNNGLPAQPSVYVDLFAEEDDKRGIESESDDTGSSVSTVIEKFSRGSTANSSFSEIHHGSSSVPQFDLKQVLSPFEQLERELDEAAQSVIASDEHDSLPANTQTATEKVDVAIMPPESFQDGALNILASNSFYKSGNSPISPPGDSGFAEDLEDEEEPQIKYPNSPLIFPTGIEQGLSNSAIESQIEIDDDPKNDILSTDNEEFVDSPEIIAQHRDTSKNYQNIEVFVDDINGVSQDYVNIKASSEDENEEYVDGPMDAEVEKYTLDMETPPPAVPQKREVPKPPPVPPRLSIPKTPRKSHETLSTSIKTTVNAIVPPKNPDSKEKPRAAKVIPTSLLEPTVVGAIEKKQPTVHVSPDRSRKAALNNSPKITEGVKLRSKNNSKDNLGGRRPRSLVLSETPKSGSDHNVIRPRSMSLEDAEGTLMSRLQEIASPATSSAFPSKIPRPTFLTSPITSLERGNFTFNERSSSACVSRSNSLTAIDRELTSLPSSLNGERKGVLLSRSESLRSCTVEATETTITKMVKGKDNSISLQQSTVTECKGNESRTVRSSSSRFGFVEKSEGRRVNFTRSSSSNARINGSNSNGKNESNKKKLVRSHSAQGELGRRSSKEEPTARESPKNKKKETETKAKESAKSSTEPLKSTCSGGGDCDKKPQRAVKESETDAKRQGKEISNQGILSNVETPNFDAQDEDVANKTPDITVFQDDPRVSIHQDDSRALPNDKQVEENAANAKMEAKENEVFPITPCQNEARFLDEEITAPELSLVDKSGTSSVFDADATEEPGTHEEVDTSEEIQTKTKATIPRHFYESTVEVINPAFQEHYDSWLASSFQKNGAIERQGEVLILGPSTNSDDSPESSLLDDVLRKDEESLQFRVEVGMPQDHNGGSEIIELQPGQNSLGFFNPTSVDPFGGENACKSSYAWNLSRWPLQDVPEEEEPIEEEQEESDNLEEVGETTLHSETKKPQIGDTEEIHRPLHLADKGQEAIVEGSIIDRELTNDIERERPLAEGSSPVSTDSNKSLLTDVQSTEVTGQHLVSIDSVPTDQLDITDIREDIDNNSVLEGQELEERKELSDEMDIYLSGPSSYRVNQHQVAANINEVRDTYRDFKLSPPPPPTYSRAPPDGHEFPPNYCEPAVPPPPATLPPSMPTVSADKCPSGEKATLVRESSSSSLSRSFSLSSPPEYLAKEGLTTDGKSYKETIAFHNQRKQQNGALPARLTNGSNNRWNSEECLSKNATNGSTPSGRLFSRRENEKSPSVRDRIALFSKPDEPVKTSPAQQTVFTTTSKSVNLIAPKREYAPTKTEEDRVKPLTNGDAKDFADTRLKNGVSCNEAIILRSKKEEITLAKPNQETPSIQTAASPARRESSPYISNYPQTQLTRTRFSYGGQKLGDEVGRRSSMGSYPPPYLEPRRQSTTKLKGLVIPDKATFASKTENRLPTIIRSSSVTTNFVNSYEKPVTSLSEANTFQARSDLVVEAAKPSMAVSLDSAAWKHQSRVSAVQKEHQPAFKSHSLDLPKTVAMTSSVASTVSSSSMSSLTTTQTNGSKQSTFQFSLSHSKPVTPTLPEKPIIVSPTPSSNSSSSLSDPPTEKTKTTTTCSVDSNPPPLPASRPPNAAARETKDINQNSLALANNKTESSFHDYKQSTTNVNKLSALDRLDSLVLTNSLASKTNDETTIDNSRTTSSSNNNNNVNLNHNIINARHQTYVEQVISREDILLIASNGGAMTPDFMSCGSSVFSNSSTSDSRLWSTRPSESDDDTNSVISLRTEDSRQTADDSMSDATTDSMDRLNSDLKPRRLSQQTTVLRASMDSADSVKNFRALAERWEMRAVDSDSSARSTPNGSSPVTALPTNRKESVKSISPTVNDSSFKLPPSLLPRSGSDSVDGKEKPSSPTGKHSRETRSYSVNNDSWSSAFVKERLEASANDRGKILPGLERSVSSFNLDSGAKSLDTTNNKVNRAVSYASGIGKSNRSISVSDIRKTFESQTKSELTPKITNPEIPERSDILIYNHSSSNGSLSSYALSKESRSSSTLLPTTTNNTTTEIHHKRFSSMDSTASDSGVSTPAHYGSTSSLAAPSTGSREHFGSVTSLASTSSLISPQELQQLIDEANQSLNEELSISGGSAGHDISVVVLHKDSLSGGVGITLAGGADYETKEITIHKIITGSLADRDERLRKGDRIVSINGKNLRGVTHREALDILKSPRQEVVLVISRERQVVGPPISSLSSSIESVRQQSLDQGLGQVTQTRGEQSPSSSSNVQPKLNSLSSVTENTIKTRANISLETGSNLNTSTPTASQSGSHVMIQLKKDGSGLGFSLEGGKDSPFGDKPLTVKRVFKGGAADKEGTLKATNEIISVNHQSVTNMTRTEAWNFMKKLSDGPVSIVIRKS